MDQKDAEYKLLNEGLKNYPDVKRAVEAFESLIEEASMNVIRKHLKKIRTITEYKQLDEENISVDRIFDEQGYGIFFWVPVIYRISMGVKWVKLGTFGLETPYVFVSTITNNTDQCINLYQTFIESNVKEENIKKVNSYEIHISDNISYDITFNQLENAMDTVLSNYISMVRDAGGLKAAISKKRKRES